MVLFFCLTTLQNWQNCPAALTNHSGFLSIQLGFFRTSRGGANIKQFYASVECLERGLSPMTINLVVADVSRSKKTICLAAPPILKVHVIPGRARLFE